MALDIGPNDLRNWAKDADDYGRRWVPVSPGTLRALADRIDPPCPHCRGTGEWRGYCHCPAGQALTRPLSP